MAISLGQRLRVLREEKDLSLRELARRIDKSAAFLSDIELGRRFPSAEVLRDLARVLGTTEKDLRSYDTRPALEEIRRMALENPRYGFAFRTLVEEGLSPEELLEAIKSRSRRKKS